MTLHVASKSHNLCTTDSCIQDNHAHTFSFNSSKSKDHGHMSVGGEQLYCVYCYVYNVLFWDHVIHHMKEKLLIETETKVKNECIAKSVLNS